jgi:hypothetical protein
MISFPNLEPRLPPVGYFDVHPNQGVRYVSQDGDDANDGYSVRSPKFTFLAAFDSLPANGGIIYVIGDVHVGGEVPSQGIRLGDGLQATYPGARATKKLMVKSLGGSARTGLFSGPVSRIIPGRPGDVTRPSDRFDVGLWIANTSTPMIWEGIMFEDYTVPFRLAVSMDPLGDPDALVNATRGLAAQVNLSWFVDCTFQCPDDGFPGRDTGPCIDEGYNIFCYFINCVANNNGSQDFLSDRAAGWLVKPAQGSAPISTRRCRGANGGVKYYNGPSSWGVYIDDYLVEGHGNDLPPIVKLIGCDGAGQGYINGAGGADSSNQPMAVDTVDSPSMPPGSLTVLSCGTLVVGPALVNGGYFGNASVSPPPPVSGQIALLGRKFWGESDIARFNTPIITNRFRNMIPMRSGPQGLSGPVVNPPDVGVPSSNRVWTSAGASGGGDVINAPIADRLGGTNAIRIGTNDGNESYQPLFAFLVDAAAGDAFIAGAWIRSSAAYIHQAFDLNITGGAGTTTRKFVDHGQPEYSTDGQWQFVWAYTQVLTATGGATVACNFGIHADPGVDVDVDGRFLINIKAGTISPFEFATLVQNLTSYVQGPLGAASSQPGQMIIAQGGLGTANSLTATGPVGTIVAKEPAYDGEGTLIGYRPIYDTIT